MVSSQRPAELFLTQKSRRYWRRAFFNSINIFKYARGQLPLDFSESNTFLLLVVVMICLHAVRMRGQSRLIRNNTRIDMMRACSL